MEEMDDRKKQTIRFSQDVSMTKTDSGSVLLHRKVGKFWQFNATATYLLDKIAHGAELSELVDFLVSRWPKKSERAKNDLEKFIDQLAANGLVVNQWEDR